MEKTNKEYIKELQVLTDKHDSLKNEAESLLKKGESIKDKLKDSERVFSITESINTIMLEIDEVENEYYSILDDYKKRR